MIYIIHTLILSLLITQPKADTTPSNKNSQRLGTMIESPPNTLTTYNSVETNLVNRIS